MESEWQTQVKALYGLIMRPVVFNDMAIVMVDAKPAFHGKGWTAEPHTHVWYEFNHISRGSFRTMFGSRTVVTPAGYCLCIPPGVSHSHVQQNDDGDDGFCIRWTIQRAGGIPERSGQGSTYSYVQSSLGTAEISALSTADEMLLNLAGSPRTMQESLFLNWLILLCTEMGGEDCQQTGRCGTGRNDPAEKLICYLSDHYMNRQPVRELAASVNLSYRQAARLFKLRTGMTILQNLNDIRICRSGQLLVETDKPVKQIADEVGFENEFYFSTVFKQITHLSPSEFRLKYSGR